MLLLTLKSFNHPSLSLSALQENSCENGAMLLNWCLIQRDLIVDRWPNPGKQKTTGREKFPLPNTSAAHRVKGAGEEYFIPISWLKWICQIFILFGSDSLPNVRFGALSSLSLSSLGLLKKAFWWECALGVLWVQAAAIGMKNDRWGHLSEIHLLWQDS